METSFGTQLIYSFQSDAPLQFLFQCWHQSEPQTPSPQVRLLNHVLPWLVWEVCVWWKVKVKVWTVPNPWLSLLLSQTMSCLYKSAKCPPSRLEFGDQTRVRTASHTQHHTYISHTQTHQTHTHITHITHTSHTQNYHYTRELLELVNF